MLAYKHLKLRMFSIVCTEDCEAGYERNATGFCVLCARGSWRDLSEDDCQACDAGKTTIPGEIGVNSEKCSMGK